MAAPPRYVCCGIIRTLAAVLLSILLLYPLANLFHVSHHLQPEFHSRTLPRSDPPVPTDPFYRCHDCASLASRRTADDTGVFTCHDCNATLASTDDTLCQRPVVPLTLGTVDTIKEALIDDYLKAGGVLLDLFHCSWYGAWWCHSMVRYVVGFIASTSPVSVELHPVSLAVVCLAVAIVVAAVFAVHANLTYILHTHGVLVLARNKRSIAAVAANDRRVLSVDYVAPLATDDLLSKCE